MVHQIPGRVLNNINLRCAHCSAGTSEVFLYSIPNFNYTASASEKLSR